jgi:hypothetical protein|tara:strand:+ start:256 stop:453 length:198 start_codon:yes stop_codon:yes gene_type:complete
MPRKKIADKPDLVKDTVSGAVINTNTNAFTARREQMAAQKEREEEFQTMKKDLEELKKLVKKLSK